VQVWDALSDQLGQLSTSWIELSHGKERGQKA
jgi:hypothetical protein